MHLVVTDSFKVRKPVRVCEIDSSLTGFHCESKILSVDSDPGRLLIISVAPELYLGGALFLEAPRDIALCVVEAAAYIKTFSSCDIVVATVKPLIGCNCVARGYLWKETLRRASNGGVIAATGALAILSRVGYPTALPLFRWEYALVPF